MPMTMLFGALQDLAGWTSRDIEAANLGEVIAYLEAEDDRLGERLRHSSTLVILNATLVPFSQRSADHPLGPGDEVAFGSPVSGG